MSHPLLLYCPLPRQVEAELPVFAHKVSYSLSYDLKILAEPGAVRALDSPQPIRVVPPPDTGDAALRSGPAAHGGSCCWSVRLSEEVADPSRDLTLTLEMNPDVTGWVGPGLACTTGLLS